MPKRVIAMFTVDVEVEDHEDAYEIVRAALIDGLRRGERATNWEEERIT